MQVTHLFVRSMGRREWDGMTITLPLYMRYDNAMSEEQLSSVRASTRKFAVSYFQKHTGRMPTVPVFVERGVS